MRSVLARETGPSKPATPKKRASDKPDSDKPDSLKATPAESWPAADTVVSPLDPIAAESAPADAAQPAAAQPAAAPATPALPTAIPAATAPPEAAPGVDAPVAPLKPVAPATSAQPTAKSAARQSSFERLREIIARRYEARRALRELERTKKTKVRIRKPGKWHEETISLHSGRIDLAPWVLPARTYRIYVPAKLAVDPCIVMMLHGCKQTAIDIAEGTRVNEHADDRGWIVVYPEQTNAANKYGCWNWFDPANLRGDGECALVLAMHEAVRKRFKIRKKRTFLAGMSAGGALVSQLALLYSRDWAGVAIHSGLPFGAATDPWSAQRAMKEGATDLAAVRELKRRSKDASPMPAIILHGNEDDVVHRQNANLLVRQFLGWNGYFAEDDDWATVPLPPVENAALSTSHGHSYFLRHYGEDKLPPVRECEVIGMGHAWSGGLSELPFHDELGPDASALMMEFFSGVAERK
jgi:poly(3-hydroxybutyrate) depolymerase